jgi:hypothetical protein
VYVIHHSKCEFVLFAVILAVISLVSGDSGYHSTTGITKKLAVAPPPANSEILSLQ